MAGSEDAGSSHKKELTGYLVNTAEVPAKQEADNGQEQNVAASTAEVVYPETTIVETPEVVAGDLLQGVEAPLQDDAVAESQALTALPSSEPTEGSVELTAEDVRAFTSAESSRPVAFPSARTAEIASPSLRSASIAVPDSHVTVEPAASVAFPASPETASQTGSERAQTPGVTFQNTDNPSHTGTPDPEAEGKRRRTLSTQGIQRFARRISIGPLRQGSSSSIPKFAGVIPGLRREGTGGSSKDDKVAKNPTSDDSPSASVTSDIGNKKAKKDKRKSSVNQAV